MECKMCVAKEKGLTEPVMLGDMCESCRDQLLRGDQCNHEEKTKEWGTECCTNCGLITKFTVEYW